jgi:hypothetical protein
MLTRREQARRSISFQMILFRDERDWLPRLSVSFHPRFRGHLYQYSWRLTNEPGALMRTAEKMAV